MPERDATEAGRPPLDPATKAHDDAYMAGLIRGRELEREAAEPERIASGSQQSRPLASQFVTTANSAAEPAGLDVERLARALVNKHWYDDDDPGMGDAMISAHLIAAEYARLTREEGK